MPFDYCRTDRTVTPSLPYAYIFYASYYLYVLRFFIYSPWYIYSAITLIDFHSFLAKEYVSTRWVETAPECHYWSHFKTKIIIISRLRPFFAPVLALSILHYCSAKTSLEFIYIHSPFFLLSTDFGTRAGTARSPSRDFYALAIAPGLMRRDVHPRTDGDQRRFHRRSGALARSRAGALTQPRYLAPALIKPIHRASAKIKARLLRGTA